MKLQWIANVQFGKELSICVLESESEYGGMVAFVKYAQSILNLILGKMLGTADV